MADTTSFLPLRAIITFGLELAQVVGKIHIDDCFFHDVMWPYGYVIDGESADFASAFVSVDSTIITNSLLYKTPKAINYKNTIANYILFENNSVWYGERQVIRAEDSGNGSNPEIMVNHNTFYQNANRVVQFRLGLAENNLITIKNNIFANILNDLAGGVGEDNLKDPIQIRTGENTLITHNCFFNTAELADVADTTDIVDNMRVDPMFANAPFAEDPGPDADFTLSADSPVLGQADDGSAIGDLKWDPTATAVDNNNPGSLPRGFVLEQNYPNPFNPTTTIAFTLKENGLTTLSIYNTLGQNVATLLNKPLSAGSHSVQFNAIDIPLRYLFL